MLKESNAFSLLVDGDNGDDIVTSALATIPAAKPSPEKPKRKPKPRPKPTPEAPAALPSNPSPPSPPRFVPGGRGFIGNGYNSYLYTRIRNFYERGGVGSMRRGRGRSYGYYNEKEEKVITDSDDDGATTATRETSDKIDVPKDVEFRGAESKKTVQEKAPKSKQIKKKEEEEQDENEEMTRPDYEKMLAEYQVNGMLPVQKKKKKKAYSKKNSKKSKRKEENVHKPLGINHFLMDALQLCLILMMSIIFRH